MRNLVFILMAFIAAATFIRAYGNSRGSPGVSEAAIILNGDN
jgi:hypothetical protein